jgi:imidazoleglycerol phosphate synthase glutamine amidotransferase subunit HisH
MTTVTDQNTLQTLIADTVIAASTKAPEPPKKSDDYRYYHCHLGWNSINCKKVDGPSVMPTEENSLLLFVNRYIPECLDSQVLKYKWIPNHVHIEK